ncbi:collagen alpha-1(XIV) chain-like [Mytilus trossulus]|uniref:collagen alpha-1(XIV) chain-like n=1 Tax=Mytilus trossulus TaxID=6551 RepID=UPI003003FD0D
MLNLLSNILLSLLVCDFKFIECACHDKVDVVYLVDSSGSVGSTNFNKEKEFINNSLSQFVIGYNDALVGVVTFSTRPYEQFKLNAFLDKPALKYAITKIPYLAGNTHTAEAINFVNNNMFIPSSGDRPDAQNVLVVLTDGHSGDPSKTLQEANRLKQRNTVIIAVGIGSGVSKSELNGLVSDPSNVFFVNDFNALKQIHDVVHSVACNLGPCVDVDLACSGYGPNTFVCTTYKGWATINCAHYCGFCHANTATTHGEDVTKLENLCSCVDVIPNCNKYGPTVCVGTYKPWASRNCAYYCNLCNALFAVVPVVGK